ncbi:unnamed protein product [Pseudo-nitzschia multistriata]|uniref:HMG box domain-containing protein n=1 Tax=Pseudo-nitzschia multistriata TaxID=183589 RepID=A0A448ZFM0_9STRA|nr:unnamed protein product [Pseudo-nitzschia multistriata]
MRERIVAGNLTDLTAEEVEVSVQTLLKSKKRGPKKRQERKSHNQISFGDLARTIATKWKAIEPDIKAVYTKFAKAEKSRYTKEVLAWKRKKESELHAAASRPRTGNGSSTHSLSTASLSQSWKSLSLQGSFSNGTNQADSSSSSLDEVLKRQRDILVEMGFPEKGLRESDAVARQVPDAEQDPCLQQRRATGFFRTGDPIGCQNSNTNGCNGDDNISQNCDTLPENIMFGDCGSEEQRRRRQQRDQKHWHQQHQSQQEHQQHDVEDFQGSEVAESQLQPQTKGQHILLRLQEQQLQQLWELQKARDETSRMSNITTTNILSHVRQPRISNCDHSNALHLGQQQQRSRIEKLTDSQNQWLSMMEQSDLVQLKRLEEITKKLDDLKDQQRRLKQLTKDCHDMDESMFRDAGSNLAKSISKTYDRISNNDFSASTSSDSPNSPVFVRCQLSTRQPTGGLLPDDIAEGHLLGGNNNGLAADFNQACRLNQALQFESAFLSQPCCESMRTEDGRLGSE